MTGRRNVTVIGQIDDNIIIMTATCNTCHREIGHDEPLYHEMTITGYTIRSNGADYPRKARADLCRDC